MAAQLRWMFCERRSVFANTPRHVALIAAIIFQLWPKSKPIRVHIFNFALGLAEKEYYCSLEARLMSGEHFKLKS